MKINPQIENEINLGVQALRRGEPVVFPGETGWNIGCDLSKIEMVKNMMSDDSFIFPTLLLDDAGKLNKYLKVIPEMLWDLSEFSTRPLNLIVENVVNLPKEIVNELGETTIRIVKDDFTKMLLHKFGKPVFTASLVEQQQPVQGKFNILNTPAHVVNLRIPAHTTPDSLVILRLSGSGRIEFLKQ